MASSSTRRPPPTRPVRPLRTFTFVGEVTGKEPEPSDVIAGGYRQAARLREIDPLPLAQVREHLPASRLRFSFFELDAVDSRGHPGACAIRMRLTSHRTRIRPQKWCRA